MSDGRNAKGRLTKHRDRSETGLRKLAQAPKKPRRKRKKPTHYKIVSISLYTEDIAKIDELVAYLQANGHPKASRSALIRYMIDTVDISQMPKSY